ncbi:MAG: hypothetical protein CMM18_03475 [Rhodospirillaceae bacterium]|nr:hypothetical protein [Rhodospirillaceae bacterium]
MNQLFKEKYIRTQDGLRLYLRDYNEYSLKNTPIICLPGLTRNSKDFHNFAKIIYKSRRVISIDMRGRGKSSFDSNAANYWKPAVYMNDIFSITAALNIHNGIFVGTSLGGLMAMQVALVRPSCVLGIILNDIGPDLPINGVKTIHSNLNKLLKFKNWEEAKNYYQDKYNFHHPNFSSNQWLQQTKNTFKSENNLIVSDYDIKILSEAINTSQSNDLWKLYSAIKNIPTVCIRGKLSDILLEKTFNKMKKEKKDLIQITVENCGHNPQLDEPEVIYTLDNFFKSIDQYKSHDK